MLRRPFGRFESTYTSEKGFVLNSKQMEKKLRVLITRKPRIDQPGRLVTHVLHEINVGRDHQGRHGTLLTEALEKLESEGLLRLERTGAILNGYRVLRAADKTKKKVTAPPVADSGIIPTPKEETTVASAAIKESEEVSSKELSRAEKVTLALAALQEHADEKGHLYVESTATVIAAALSVSDAEARELNRPLQQLQLRKSPAGRNPGGKRPHWVTREVTEVTEAMLQQAAVMRDSGEPIAESAEDVQARLLEIINGLETEVATLRESANNATSLVEIVTELEGKVAERDELMVKATQRIAELTTQVDALGSERDSLRTQLLALRSPSPAVLNVLERYGKLH